MSRGIFVNVIDLSNEKGANLISVAEKSSEADIYEIVDLILAKTVLYNSKIIILIASLLTVIINILLWQQDICFCVFALLCAVMLYYPPTAFTVNNFYKNLNLLC